MSDTTASAPAAEAPATGTEPTDQTTQQPADQQTQEPDWKAEADKWKALSRQNESQAKANAEKAKRFDELEEANKTELQKAQDAAAAAIARAEKAESDRLRSDVARTKGVPLELLTGNTEDDLNAAADALIAFRGEQQGPAAGGAEIGGGAAKPTTYTRDQIRDPGFYREHREDILKAQRDGRII